MPLTPGTRIGSYEIHSGLGAGGMGEVYRARDTKLGRDVALKILPDTFARDLDRIARFQREAHLLATLNHPQIAAIYGLEESNDVRALVLELVDGPTLADRIAARPLSLDDALKVARQIAEALDAAHQCGITHRDLKPSNIKLTADGRVKVLDFGLAKMHKADGPEADLSASPTTLTSVPGMIVGTAAYMSPEQAEGRDATHTSDVWAFGCVLYEMLTGRAAFGGRTAGEIFGNVLRSDVDWNRLPEGTPDGIRRLLQRCLQRDPNHRLRDIADARLEIEDALREPRGGERVVRTGVRLPERIVWAMSTAVLIGVAALSSARALRRAPPPSELRLDVATPYTLAPFEHALSPDGRAIAFVASGDGAQRVWIRALDRVESQPLPATEGARYPFWSADSRAVAYFVGGKLYRVDRTGGSPQALANAPLPLGGTWNAEGTILFAATGASPVLRMAASGGESSPVTRLDPPAQTSHRFPQFLPDGRHFLYRVLGTPEAAGVYLGSLDGESKRLVAADSSAAFLAPDFIVFQRQSALVAQRLDLERRELTGDAVRLAEPAGSPPAIGQSGFSVSTDGRIAYRAGGAEPRQLTWYDRSGRTLGTAGQPDATLQYPELSPDGQRVLFTRSVQGNLDIWLEDLVRGGMTRFTVDPSIDTVPLWSPDGTRVAFTSNRSGIQNLYVGAPGRADSAEALLESAHPKLVEDWSRDGRFLVYQEIHPKTGRDLWVLPMTGSSRKPLVAVNTSFEEQNGQLSPDVRWLAYETNESGRFEIVVQSFPEGGHKWPVSTGGGVQPRWRADGKELYFIAPDGKLMSASITSTGAAFAAGTPVALFPVRIVSGVVTKSQYAVSRDGRFLINRPSQESMAPITLILNWKPPGT